MNIFKVAVITLSQMFVLNSVFAVDSNQSQNNLSVTTGYSFTTGKYNQAVSTIIETVPVTAQYNNRDWQLGVTVSFLRVTGNGSVIPGTGGPMVFRDFDNGSFGSGMGGGSMGNGSASNTTTITNSGLGDVVAKLTHPVYTNSDNSVKYNLATSVKFATADVQKGLGTGENDYSIDVTGMFANAKSISYLTLGYSVNGDTAQITYQDVIYANAGIVFTLDEKKSLGLSYGFQQAGVDGVEDFQQLNISLSWVHSKDWSMSLSGLTGLTKSSPDFGASLMVSNNF